MMARQRSSATSIRSSTSTLLISDKAMRMTPKRNFSLARMAFFIASVKESFIELKLMDLRLG